MTDLLFWPKIMGMAQWWCKQMIGLHSFCVLFHFYLKVFRKNFLKRSCFITPLTIYDWPGSFVEQNFSSDPSPQSSSESHLQVLRMHLVLLHSNSFGWQPTPTSRQFFSSELSEQSKTRSQTFDLGMHSPFAQVASWGPQVMRGRGEGRSSSITLNKFNQ